MESRSGSKPTLYMKRDRYPEDEGLAIWQKKKNHVFIESQKGKKKKLQLAGFFYEDLLHHSSRLYGVEVSL